MHSFQAKLSPPNGLHARPCAILVTIQKSYFPNDPIVLIDLKTRAEASMGQLVDVMVMAVRTGQQVEFLTVMNDETFHEFEEIIFLLSYVPTFDSSGQPDAEYSPSFAVSECKGDKPLLLSRLRSAAAVSGRHRVFCRVGAEPVTRPAFLECLGAAIGDAPKPKRVFVSYSHLDLGFVESTLVPLLRGAGFDPWFALDSIRGADRWERSILKGLQQADWFAVVMSPHAATSEWVQLEVQWASEHRHGKIVPIMISDCDPWELHLRLGSLQYIDFRSQHDEARRRLIAVLQGNA